MGEEKTEGVSEEKTRRFALGGRAVAALSILLVVPAIRRLRAQQHQKHRRHFPIFGH